jgi:hypothetical protein
MGKNKTDRQITRRKKQGHYTAEYSSAVLLAVTLSLDGAELCTFRHQFCKKYTPRGEE